MKWLYGLIFLAIIGMLFQYKQNTEEALREIFGLDLNGRKGFSIGHMSHINNAVQVRTKPYKYYDDGEIGMEVFGGDRVVTLKNSQVRVELKIGFIITIDSDSSLDLISDENKNIAINLNSGRIEIQGVENSAPLQVSHHQGRLKLSGRDHIRMKVKTGQAGAEVYVFEKTGLEIINRKGLHLIHNQQSNLNKMQLNINMGLRDNTVLPQLLDSETIVAEIEGQISKIQECTSRVLKRKPASASVKIALRLQGKTGNVLKATLHGANMKPKERSCILFYIKTIRFPRFRSKEQRVTVPFVIP